MGTDHTGYSQLDTEDLWFCVQRVTDHTQRAACYLCGWWSEDCQPRSQTHIALAEHLATMGHRLAVQRFVASHSDDTSFCPHCGQITWHAEPGAPPPGSCARCQHRCEDVPVPPAPASGESFTCCHCRKTSHNPNDVLYGYCGWCHHYCADVPPPPPRPSPRPPGSLLGLLPSPGWHRT